MRSVKELKKNRLITLVPTFETNRVIGFLDFYGVQRMFSIDYDTDSVQIVYGLHERLRDRKRYALCATFFRKNERAVVKRTDTIIRIERCKDEAGDNSGGNDRVYAGGSVDNRLSAVRVQHNDRQDRRIEDGERQAQKGGRRA